MASVTRLNGQEATARLLADAARLAEDWPEFRTAVGEKALESAQTTVRKKTETLMKSITMVDTGVAVHIFTNLRYAWPVHAGVPKEDMLPNRFLLPLAYELDPTETWESMMADRLEA